MQTRSFDLVCPLTGETVPAHLNGAEFFTRADIDGMRPETQIWWSEIVRQYALARGQEPTGDPTAILERVLMSWPEHHTAPR